MGSTTEPAGLGLTVLLGGARSGKSALAIRLGRAHRGDVTLIATCPRIDGDTDLDERIAAHRAERPGEWNVVEEEHDLAGALAAARDSLAIIDCLTLWLANALHRGDRPEAIEASTVAAIEVATHRRAPTVVVSNEVGLGIVPEIDLSRVYRDLLGRVNQRWAAAADRAVFLVAGRAVALNDPWAALGLERTEITR